MNKIFVALIVMISLDFIYLSNFKNFFNKLIKSIQKQDIKMNYTGLIATYAVLFMSYYYFIIKKKGTVTDAFILGISIYGVYELTNYSLFNNWNMKAVILDTLWGGILFSLTRYLTN